VVFKLGFILLSSHFELDTRIVENFIEVVDGSNMDYNYIDLNLQGTLRLLKIVIRAFKIEDILSFDFDAAEYRVPKNIASCDFH
jgi:hypothetical protein